MIYFVCKQNDQAIVSGLLDEPERVTRSMNLFHYCYNILFVLIFVVAIMSCFITYSVTHRRVFRYLGTLFFLYILESIYMFVAFIFGSDHSMTTLFAAAEVYVIGILIYNFFGKVEKRTICRLFFLALCTFLCEVAPIRLPLFGEVGVFRECSVYSTAILIECAAYWYIGKHTPEYQEQAQKYKGCVLTAAVFYCLALLESMIYTHWDTIFTNRSLPFYANNINIFTDAFCLLFSIWVILFSEKDRANHMKREVESLLQQRMNEFQVHEQEKSHVMAAAQLDKFCAYYKLTEREAEILCLVLEGKSNQEISQVLYITVGTVKAHLHSIFSKLEVSRRSQLMTLFMNYEKAAPDMSASSPANVENQSQ